MSPNPPPLDGSFSFPPGFIVCSSAKGIGWFVCGDDLAPRVVLEGRDDEKAFDASSDVVAIRTRLMAMMILFFLMDVHPYFVVLVIKENI